LSTKNVDKKSFLEGWRNPSGKIDGTGGIDGRDGGIPPEGFMGGMEGSLRRD